MSSSGARILPDPTQPLILEAIRAANRDSSERDRWQRRIVSWQLVVALVGLGVAIGFGVATLLGR